MEPSSLSSIFSPEELALHQCVLADPECDEPRLVYADWLEERGDLRAEFIRVQIELFHAPLLEPPWQALKQREMEIFAAGKACWVRQVLAVLHAAGVPTHHRKRHIGPGDWTYERGFITAMTVRADLFCEFADLLFALGPLRSVRLHRVNLAAVRGLVDTPALFNLRSLSISGSASSEAIAQLLLCPWMANLTELDLSHNRLEGAAVRALLESPFLSSLHRLRIDGATFVGADSLARLVARFGDSAVFYKSYVPAPVPSVRSGFARLIESLTQW